MGRDGWGWSVSSFSARPYQLEAREAAYKTWEESQGAMLVMSTGTGKTLTALNIAQDFLQEGGRVVWLAHRRELLLQALKALNALWPHVKGGIVQASRDESDAQVVFASVDTLRTPKRLQGIIDHGRPSLVVVDECHHSTSNTQRNAIQGLTEGGVKMLGLTATPDRDDGGDLTEHWEVAYSFNIQQAIDQGFLVPPMAAIAPMEKLDLSQLSAGGLDYNAGELGRELVMQGMVEHTVTQMRRALLARPMLDGGGQSVMTSADQHSVLVYTATVDQAERTVEALNADGWKAALVCGTTKKRIRERSILMFERGNLNVLVSPAVLTEGTDIPRASCVVLARPTRVWSLFVQIVGRCLRLHDPNWDKANGLVNTLSPHYQGKRYGFVLDLVSASKEHKLIAAPVLMAGDTCEHQWERSGKHGGKCTILGCKARVSCFELKGAHKYNDEHVCTACEAPRCPQSPGMPHYWVPTDPDDPMIRQCINCGAESRLAQNPMEKRRGSNSFERAHWLKVPKVTPDTWAVDLGDHGILYVVQGAESHLYHPWWAPKRKRKARSLTGSDVTKDIVRAYADDLVTRAKRLSGPRDVTPGQRDYAKRLGVSVDKCENGTAATVKITRYRARARAIALGIVQDTANK